VSEALPVSMKDIQEAQALRVAAHVRRTPMVHSHALSRIAGADVYLKLECWQHTGSFKVRGALNRLATLSQKEREGELVTASAGNHALGVAYAASKTGCTRVRIFLPVGAPRSKVGKLEGFGVQVVFAGKDYEEAHAAAEAYTRETGALYIHAYDDPTVIAGQGTVGLEIMSDIPDVDVILVPVGGGGLSAGVALVAKTMRPQVRVLGVQPQTSPSAYLSLRDARPYEHYDAAPTIAEGLAGGYGQLPFQIAQKYMDGVLLVEETQIRRMVVEFLRHEALLVEGSGAIALAPLMDRELNLQGKKVVLVLTGGNIDVSLVRELLNEAAA
jgi:threonine dehydratase